MFEILKLLQAHRAELKKLKNKKAIMDKIEMLEKEYAAVQQK